MIESTETTRTAPRVESHLEPSHAWIAGLALAEDGTVLAAPDVRSDDGAWPASRETAERATGRRAASRGKRRR